MSEMNKSSQHALDRALREGLRVRVPEGDELLVDIDSEADFASFQERYQMLSDLGIVNGYRKAPSKSGIAGRSHIVVKVNIFKLRDGFLTPIERIALQAILGSDYRREANSYHRILDGDPIPTLFYETADNIN